MSLADETYDSFQHRPGSDFIATRYALGGLVRTLRRRAPTSVLEVGPGIGTTTRVVISTLDAVHGPGAYTLYGIEHVPFCLKQMARNLGPDRARTVVVDRYEEIPGDHPPFEFVLIDGGGEGEDDGSLPAEHVADQNRRYVSELAPRAVVFVENKRPAQRAIVERELTVPYAYAHVRPWDDGAGYHLYQLHPTATERLRAAGRGVLDRVWFDTGLARRSARTVRRVRRRLRR